MILDISRKHLYSLSTCSLTDLPLRRNPLRKIIVFTNISLDGYFEAPGHDISWAANDFEAFQPHLGKQVDYARRAAD